MHASANHKRGVITFSSISTYNHLDNHEEEELLIPIIIANLSVLQCNPRTYRLTKRSITIDRIVIDSRSILDGRYATRSVSDWNRPNSYLT